MPLLFLNYYFVCLIGLIATAVSALIYFVGGKKQRQASTLTFISLSASRQRRKWVWILWGIFFLVMELATAAVSFCSNLWFGLPIKITGPYSFAQLAVRFYLPLLTIFVPITVGSFTNILSNFERRHDHENEK